MEAYTESVKSAYLIEKEQWEDALNSLLRAKAIYSNIIAYKDSIEGVVFEERVGQLDTFIRLC